MNYDNYIVKLYLRKNKKLFFLFSIVIILSCIFAISFSTFKDSIAKTEEGKRKDIYGSWHAAVFNTNEDIFHQLNSHVTINMVGKMSIQGFVLNKNKDQIGAIGSVDQNMIDQGLSLLEGKFPEKEDEIAIEMSYLSMLGYSFELGQPILLDIAVYDKVNGKVIQLEKTFILTGVIQNYSSIWKTNDYQMVSFFINENALGLKTPNFVEHIFCEIDDMFVRNASEIQMLTKNGGAFELNDYTYLYYSSNISKETVVLDHIILIIIISATASFFNINILIILMKRQAKSLMVMRSIGASKSQIFCIYLKALLVVVLGAFLIGVALGLSSSYLGYLAIKKFLIPNFIFDIHGKKTVLLVITIIFSILIFTTISITSLGRVSFYGNIQLHMNRKMKMRKKVKHLTMFQIMNILNRAHRKETVIRFILTVLTFLIVSSTCYRTYRNYKDNLDYVQMYDSDYEIGFMLTYYEPLIHIEQEELQKVNNIYGIDHISAYQISNYLPFTWAKIDQSQYAQVTSKYIFSEFAKQNSPHATALGISNNQKDWDFYINEVDDGKVSYEQLIQGKEVIIYLPRQYLSNENRLKDSLMYSHNMASSSSTVYTEDTISVGDSISIRGKKGEEEVKIAGIITSFSSKNSKSFLTKPYTIICNTEMYKKLVSTENEKSYEYIQIYCNKNANYERTDIEMSKFNGNISVLNHRLYKEEAKMSLFESLMISLILSFTVIMISLIVHYNSQIARMDSDIIRNQIFHMLGMEQWKIHMIYLYSTIINCIGAILIGFFIIFLYQLIEFWRIGKLNVSTFQLTNYIKDQYFKEISWVLILLFSLVFITLNIITIYIPMNRQKKKKIIL